MQGKGVGGQGNPTPHKGSRIHFDQWVDGIFSGFGEPVGSVFLSVFLFFPGLR